MMWKALWEEWSPWALRRQLWQMRKNNISIAQQLAQAEERVAVLMVQRDNGWRDARREEQRAEELSALVDRLRAKADKQVRHIIAVEAKLALTVRDLEAAETAKDWKVG